MKYVLRFHFVTVIIFGVLQILNAQSDSLLKVFQFPSDQIPRIDGDKSDWSIVPKEYFISEERLSDDEKLHPNPDTNNLKVSVSVGWVNGMNRLYFLYEAYDDYWDFSRTDLHHDIFEVVVDGDKSGGPLIGKFLPNSDSIDKWDAWCLMHGVHAQNYHIYTPPEGQDWCLAWGPQSWIKKLPYANAAYSYNFKPGEPGKMILEFWITPFDKASRQGPSESTQSVLYENKEIGLSWAIIDWDGINANSNNGFWNLSQHHTMYGNASELNTFKLMPLEEQFQDKIKADWSFEIVNMELRQVAFQDLSKGTISSWKWDFGDGNYSEEQHSVHSYTNAGLYIVTLYIEGPEGKSRMARVWEVAVR